MQHRCRNDQWYLPTQPSWPIEWLYTPCQLPYMDEATFAWQNGRIRLSVGAVRDICFASPIPSVLIIFLSQCDDVVAVVNYLKIWIVEMVSIDASSRARSRLLSRSKILQKNLILHLRAKVQWRIIVLSFRWPCSSGIGKLGDARRGAASKIDRYKVSRADIRDIILSLFVFSPLPYQMPLDNVMTVQLLFLFIHYFVVLFAYTRDFLSISFRLLILLMPPVHWHDR